MAISDKLTYLNTTKSQLKDQINYGLPTEKQITNQTIFREYVGSIFEAFLEALRNPDTLFTNLPKTSGSGSQITLNGTANAPMRINPNPTALSQTTYTGKNLLPNEKNSGTSKGIIFTAQEDGTYLVSGKNDGTGNSTNRIYNGALNLNAGTYYGIPTGTSGFSITASITYTDSTTQYMNWSASTITIPKNIASANVYLQVTTNVTTTFSNAKVYPIISTTAITSDNYEPYVGGIASPNPSYPQDIHTISGNNSVVVEGKNLFDTFVIANTSNRAIENDGTIVLNNASSNVNGYHETGKKLYELCPSLKAGDTAYLYVDTDYYYNGNKRELIYCSTIWNNGTSKTITETMLNSIVVIYGGYQTTSHIKIMITRALDTTYTPYVSQTAPINLGEYELGTIGDYKNRIFKNIPTDEDYSSEREEGAWYYKQGIGKVVLDGTRTWTKQTTWSAVGNKTNAFYIGKPTNLDSTQTCFSTHFTHVPTSTITSVDDYGIAYASNLIIRVPKSIDTNSDLQTWLSNNNVTIKYVALTPTYTKITGELANQLEQVYKGMLSYDGTTNISQVNNDLPFELVGSAIQKL